MMRRFYAAKVSIQDRRITLDPNETRHLRDVLRLRVGDVVSVFDGTGREFECSVHEVGKRSAVLDIAREVEPPAPESPLDLTLAAAITKGDKFGVTVQKSVELGVNRLIPLKTERCDVKVLGPDRAERWRKIALEAAKQCGRARLMTIDEPVDFSEFLRTIPQRLTAESKIYFFSERDGGPFQTAARVESCFAIVGPEGGWDDREIDEARKAGAVVVTLGGRILRADTAAIAITAMLQHRFGDLR
jgi:16S rRNA (uracil1498-N3)-methyltransferase